MSKDGTLVPPWFVYDRPSSHELAVASVIWGISLGLTGFGVIRASDQCIAHWRRTRKVTPYMVFIWAELIVSTVIGGIAWGYVREFIPPSLWFYTGMIFLWIIQVHCILQIILTRVALIATNKALVRRLQWLVFAICIVINIGVACIWIPARLQRSQRYITINQYWDRTEKIILAVIDVGLNLYFIYLVRSSLIAYGLTRYVRLYRFNLLCITISMAMDVLMISMMSLSNTFLYVCFHPLAYLVKLHIEMTMANLIAKIVKASSRSASCYCACHGPRADFFNQFQLDSQSRKRMAPTAGRYKDSKFVLLFQRGKEQGLMVPATDEAPLPKLTPRTEQHPPPSAMNVSWAKGWTKGWTQSVNGCEDLELGQPSSGDTTNISCTIAPPGIAWTADQGAACPHEAHCPRHMD